MHGLALRVPTKNVSLVDLVVDLKEDVTVNKSMTHSEIFGLDGILDVEDEPLVSMDFNTNPNSAVIDAQNTIVMDDNKVKVIAWYDNEWGYSNRVVEVAQQIAKLIGSENVATAK